MSSRINDTTATPRRLGGLDGLRAIAVGLVLVYHLFPGPLPGGFLGVDIFFVISGFLITTLLIDERRRNGYISLGAFWRRRARRLLPALALVLLVSTSLALLIGDSDLLVNIGAQLAGAAVFVANWVYIGLGADYFARDNPELFRNTWSLAIEEQFYLLLPLVLLAVFKMSSRATQALVFGLAGIASAWWMAECYLMGGSATRVYFGTDTHTFGLLLGVSLACAVPLWGRGRKRALHAVQQIMLLLIGVAAFVAIGWLTLTLHEGSPESFTGGFQLASLLILVVLWAASRQGSWLGVALDTQPLRWIGERSYGIYLWHWPLLILSGAWIAGWQKRAPNGQPDAWQTAVWQFLLLPGVMPTLVLVTTLAVAALSYRYIEQPIRRIGLRASLRQLMRPVKLRGRRLVVSTAVSLCLIVTVPATATAVVIAPTESSAASAISRGLAALEAQQAEAQEYEPPITETPEEPAAPQLDDEATSTDWADVPEYTAPPPEPIKGSEIFAVGDSVMLASYPELVKAFPNIKVDASVSRGLGAGVGIVDDLAQKGSLRPVIVVGLGTNGPIQDADLRRLLRIADGRKIVLVNAFADRWWTAEVNRQLRSFAEANRGVVLADWAGAISTRPDGLYGDDIHPNPAGGAIYAQAVQAALDALIQPDELPPRTYMGEVQN